MFSLPYLTSIPCVHETRGESVAAAGSGCSQAAAPRVLSPVRHGHATARPYLEGYGTTRT